MRKTLFAFILMIAISLCAVDGGIYDLQCGDVESCMRIDTMGERIAKEATIYKLYNFDSNDTLQVCGIKYVTINDTLLVVQCETLFVHSMSGYMDSAIIDSGIMCCESLQVIDYPNNNYHTPGINFNVTREEYEMMQRDLREVEIIVDIIKWFLIVCFLLAILLISVGVITCKEEK
jgi:hypothetical protein